MVAYPDKPSGLGVEGAPLVSVVILSWNRRDELRHTLSELEKQEYKHLEVIVVDNNSTDGSAEMVKTEFPGVTLIRMPTNVGIAGLNSGFHIASGKYILTLDDDSYPMKDCIETAVSILERDKTIGCIACNIVIGNDVSITSKWGEVAWTYWGCGAVFRKEALEAAGYYDEDLFLYVNEIDLAMRLYNAGYWIRYSPECVVRHKVSLLHRSSERDHYFTTRNKLIVLLKYFPVFTLAWVIPLVIASELYRALANKQLLAFLRGLSGAVLAIPKMMKKRIRLRPEVIKAYSARYKVWLKKILTTRKITGVFEDISEINMLMVPLRYRISVTRGENCHR